MSRTVEQKRALFALKFVKAHIEAATDKKDRLSTLIKKSPVQILQNGIGQTVAFLLADNAGKKADDREPSGQLYDHLDQWLCGPADADRPCRVYPAEDKLIDALIKNDRFKYLHAQQEALALLNWMKKFAEAWLAT